MYFRVFLVCALLDWKFAEGIWKIGKVAHAFDFVLSAKSQSRILGGKNATLPYPYQVSIGTPASVGPDGIVCSWRHNCGGSIITDRHILTAGFNCFF